MTRARVQALRRGRTGDGRKRSGAAKDAFAPVLRADGEGCGSVCARCTDRQTAAIPETVEKKLPFFR